MTSHDDKLGYYVFTGVLGLVALAVFLGFLLLPIIQGARAGLDPWSAICRSLGIQAGTPAQRTLSMHSEARPVSQVIWDAATIQGLNAANKELGAQLAQDVCSACHGQTGISPDPQYPHLSGQSAFAIYKQLHDYRSGVRQHDLMSPVAKTLTDEQIIALANHYATLTRGTLDRHLEVEADPRIDRLVRTGDTARAIPGCQSCHGIGAGGPVETPTLSGQYRQYLATQLSNYAAGRRRNDVFSRMRGIASKLSEEEIRLVSGFYAEQ
jgi:cytochrome c553